MDPQFDDHTSKTIEDYVQLFNQLSPEVAASVLESIGSSYIKRAAKLRGEQKPLEATELESAARALYRAADRIYGAVKIPPE